MKRALLVDGHSLLYRAYYATIKSKYVMAGPDGTKTNAISTFAQMLNRMLKNYRPDYICVAFDAGEVTFRHEMMESYKAGRKETPDDLKSQIALTREFLNLNGIVNVALPGIEADDIIGTYAKHFGRDGDVITYIASSDRDFYQLINESTFVLKPGDAKNPIIEVSANNLEGDFLGIVPSQVVLYKAITGDKSDNIPGVPGLGPKAAREILKQYDDLETLFENIDLVNPLKLREKLTSFKDQIYLSYKIASISLNVDLVPTHLELVRGRTDMENLIAFCKKYGLNRTFTTWTQGTIVE